MSANPITVIARWTLAADDVEQVLVLIGALKTATLSEPGCLGYDAFRSIETPEQILLIERYADRAAIDAHRQAAHYQELVVGRIIPLLVERKLEFLTGMDPG